MKMLLEIYPTPASLLVTSHDPVWVNEIHMEVNKCGCPESYLFSDRDNIRLSWHKIFAWCFPVIETPCLAVEPHAKDGRAQSEKCPCSDGIFEPLEHPRKRNLYLVKLL